MSHRVCLVLEFVGDAPEPIAGSIRREGGAERSLMGWLELMALVNDEMGNDRSVPSTAPPRLTDQKSTSSEPDVDT
jgi:hypothetical protein